MTGSRVEARGARARALLLRSTPTPSGCGSFLGLRGAHDHVLDGLRRGCLYPAHEVVAQPSGTGRGERGDDDLVDGVELERVLDRRERVGVHHLAGRVEALVVQALERVR